jgi:multidrug efflux system membrane fusion protein
MAKSRIRPFYVIPFVVFALIGVLWWVNHQQDVPTNIPQGSKSGKGGGSGRYSRFGTAGPLPVIAQPAKKGDMSLYLNALGSAAATTTITVKTQISGQLIDVKYQEGQTVKKGDLLAIIDPRPYQNSLEQAQGNQLQAQAQLTEAKLNLTRYKQLAQQDSIASQQVDTQAALVTQYEGLVKVYQAAIDSAQLNLTYCHIVAPVDGRVGLRLVDKGNYVTPGDSSGLVVLTQTKPISVIFSLPEDNVPAVSKRIHSGATLAVDAYDRTVSTKLASGTLTTIDNLVDQSTGTFKLKASFTNDDESLFPNQFVNVRMLLDVLHDILMIPTSSIERGEQGTYVYVVKADHTVTARIVKLGNTEGEKVQVLSGLDEGDLVVTDGADKLREGMEVAEQTPAQADPSLGRPKGPPGGEMRKRSRKGPDQATGDSKGQAKDKGK